MEETRGEVSGPAAWPGRRIVVIGTTGSGKTTLSRHLARSLGVPHVELDALHWLPAWTEAPADVFKDRVAEATAGSAWVVDGNYADVRPILWPRADTAVWLDFPLRTVLWRVTGRTFRRVLTREELWNGNRERFRTNALSRDSVILWALRTFRRRRLEYAALFSSPDQAYLRLVHLRSPREARAWLRAVDRDRIGAVGKRALQG